MAQCTAKSKQSGQRCKNHAVPGKNVCRFHGGKTPSGAASPHFRHGRYSRDLPTGLLARYEASRQDEALLASHDELALIDARIGELLAGGTDNSPGMLWLKLSAAYDTMLRASKSQDFGSGQEAFEQIGSIIKAGANDFQGWSQIAALVDLRRKVVETETKRVVAAGQVMTAEQAAVLVSALADIVRRELHDQPDTLQRIEAELIRILHRGTGEQTLPPGQS